MATKNLFEEMMISEVQSLHVKVDKVCDNTNEIKMGLIGIDNRIASLEESRSSLKRYGIKVGIPSVLVIVALSLGVHMKVIAALISIFAG